MDCDRGASADEGGRGEERKHKLSHAYQSSCSRFSCSGTNRVGSCRDRVQEIVGDAVMDKIGPICSLNEEGELQGVWRELGVPGLWYMLGNSYPLIKEAPR